MHSLLGKVWPTIEAMMKCEESEGVQEILHHILFAETFYFAIALYAKVQYASKLAILH